MDRRSEPGWLPCEPDVYGLSDICTVPAVVVGSLGSWSTLLVFPVDAVMDLTLTLLYPS